MAIFGSTNLVENFDERTYTVSPTEEGSAEIMYESTRELYKIVGAAYISDVMIESSILEGSTDISVVTEATLKEIKEKIINTFKKMIAKIKEWFKQLIESVKVFFMNGEKFAKEYGSALIKKAKDLKDDSVTYEGYEYKLQATDLKDKVVGFVEKYKKVVEGEIKNVTSATDTAEVAEKGFKAIGYETLTEAKEKFVEEVRGSVTKTTITGVGKNVSTMVDVCSKAKALINGIKELETKTEGAVKAAIADINKEEDAAVITKKTTLYNGIISVQQGFNTVATSLIKEQYRVYTSVLKAIWRYKPAKESFVGDSNDGSSLFESAMNLI